MQMKQELKSICLSWEKLRIIYNAVLFVVVVITYFISPIYLDSTTSNAIEGIHRNNAFFVLLPILAFGANILYLVGPLAEAYLYILDLSKSWHRYFMFASGLGLASLLAFLVTLDMSHYALRAPSPRHTSPDSKVLSPSTKYSVTASINRDKSTLLCLHRKDGHGRAWL